MNDNLPRVIGISGPAGSGKSTAADLLIERHGYVRVKFAAPLKAMCRAVGMSEEQIEGSLKEVPSRLLQGRTPRYVMQTLGTEWGRKTIGENLWIDLWTDSVSACLDQGGRVVCDDVRFANEALAVLKLGGAIYRLQGRGGIPGAHESERGDFMAQRIIANDGSQDELYRRLVA